MERSETKPLMGLASCICTGSAALLAWSAFTTSFNATLLSSPFTLGFHYAGVGLRRKYGLSLEDHKAGLMAGWSVLQESRKAIGEQVVAPVMESAEAMTGRDRISVPQLDITPMLTHSAAIVAPTNTGKSFFLSLAMVERERLFPRSKFTICSIDTWKRGHTWMGLGDCPQWIQQNFICLGRKYEDTHGFTESIHMETVETVESLYELMEQRAKATRDGGPHGNVDLSLNTVIIDEFPQFMEFLDSYKDGDDIRKQLKKLLVRGQGYGCVLWVISQDDAVNMLGFHQSEKKQLFICSLFKKNQAGDGHRAQIINSVKGRRVLFEHGGDAAIMPIPQLTTEPKLDWSHLIAQGGFRIWIKELVPVVQHWKSEGLSLSDAWAQVSKDPNFPGQKRQGANNPDYQYFVNNVWS